MRLEKIELRVAADKVIPFFFRADSEADKGVIEQIFAHQDYQMAHWPHGYCLGQFYEQCIKTKKPLIIDAGANIGASARFFSMLFPAAQLFALEPDKQNVELFLKNCPDENIELFQGGIADVDGTMYLNNPGRGEWGYHLGESGEIEVPTLSPQTIIHRMEQSCTPFIFKIDIEGGEAFLFSKEINWVDQFALIVIELHDWMLPFQGSSRNFFKAISQFDFDILSKGENLFCFNRRLLNQFSEQL